MGGHGGALSSTDEQQRDVVASSSHHLECQERRHSPSGRKARRASLRGRSGSRTQNRPTTFLVRHETEILHPTRSPSQGSPVEDSTYGVKSLDSSIGEEQEYDTVSSTADERSPKRKLSTSPILQHAQHLLSKTSNPPAEPSQPPSPHSFRSSPLLPLSRESSAGQLSASLTPFNIRSPYTRSDHDTSSTPRSASPRSFRSSDEDARFEHSSGSGEEGEDDAAAGASLFEEDMPLSIPQLVMPSMNFPRRRPFTERGSRVGKLRVGVAGAKGSGKTSLIRAITQCCEDIVHVDTPHSQKINPTSSKDMGANDVHSTFMKTSASTRPRPAWRDAHRSETQVIRRRSGSLHEQALDRNFTFIEYSSIDEHAVNNKPVMHKHLDELVDACGCLCKMGQEQQLDLFGGHSGPQLDALIYLLPRKVSRKAPDNHLLTKPADLSNGAREIAGLSAYTNVIPVLGKSDLLSEEETRLAIERHQAELAAHCTIHKPFDLTSPQEPYYNRPPTMFPISSLPSTDDDIMDASLLMNSSYIQPLVPSGLQDLVQYLFDPETAAMLRHLSAAKMLELAAQRQRLCCHSHNQHLDIGNTGVLVSRPSLPVAADQKALTCATSDTRGETIGQTRISRWAADLHRSLQRESERYARFTSSTNSSVPSADNSQAQSEKYQPPTTADDLEAQTLPQSLAQPQPKDQKEKWTPQDPLRLLEWDARLRRRGLIIARVLGGCGLVGAAVLWVMRLRGWGWSWQGVWNDGVNGANAGGELGFGGGLDW